MSMVVNLGYQYALQSSNGELFKLVGPLVEPSIISIENPKGSLESFLSISQPPIIVTSNSPDIPP